MADGHEVGFHCYRHVRHSEQTDGELDQRPGHRACASSPRSALEPRAWRAPWGVRDRSSPAGSPPDHGLRLWGWNLDSHDWRGDSAERDARRRSRRQGGLRDGDVVLMHDGLGPGALRRTGCEETLGLTRRLLDEAARGAASRLAPVSECEGVLA